MENVVEHVTVELVDVSFDWAEVVLLLLAVVVVVVDVVLVVLDEEVVVCEVDPLVDWDVVVGLLVELR